MTSIICTMSQCFANYQESKETLGFGSKAKQVRTLVNVNELVRDSPEEAAQRLQKVLRENEDLRSKLAAAKDEMLRAVERVGEEGLALGALRETQAYLRGMLEEKNVEIGEMGARMEEMGRVIEE
jgi:alkanesulfonate monooxygenase SsuD/methylene tetrahydromethanopterin reductase-like flavin-dependent oxidoreductase (luciferase family)